MRLQRSSQHVSKWLSAYCHDELTDSTAKQVEAHLRDCKHCRHEYEQIKLGIEFAKQLQVDIAPVTLWAGLSEKFITPVKPRRLIPYWQYAVGATVAVFLIALTWKLLDQRPETPFVPISTPVANAAAWEVANLRGTPRIGDEKINESGKLSIGEWLETDNTSMAKIKVAEIGYLDIDPNSRVQLMRSGKNEHRISLVKGKMSALILAPPRLFIVDTPSATAVDLGCAYTLEVDDAGASLLRVTSGWVSFVREEQEVFVPAGAICATRKGEGVGTPYYADVPSSFKASLAILDFGKSSDMKQAVATLLMKARQQDSLTLWHLLGRQFGELTAEVRGQIFDRLAVLSPPPATITKSGIIQGNREMLRLWWEEKIR